MKKLSNLLIFVFIVGVMVGGSVFFGGQTSLSTRAFTKGDFVSGNLQSIQLLHPKEAVNIYPMKKLSIVKKAIVSENKPVATNKPSPVVSATKTTIVPVQKAAPAPAHTPSPVSTPSPKSAPTGDGSVTFQLIQNGAVIGTFTISSSHPTWSQTYTGSQVGEYLIGPNLSWSNRYLNISSSISYGFDFAGGTTTNGGNFNASGYSCNAGFVLGTPAGQGTGAYTSETLTVSYR